VGRYISLPILIIAAVLQSTVIPEIRIGGGGPDIILMLVLSWTLLAGLEEGLVWAMVGGILQDIISGIPTGTTALALVVVVFLVNLVLGTIGRNNLVFPLFVAIIGTLLYELVLSLVLAVLGHTISPSYILIYVTLPTVAFHFILILPIFRVMGFAFEASRPRPVTL